MIQLLTLGAVLAVAAVLARVNRRIDDLRMQLAEVQQENGIEASITRRYCGRLLGDDIR